MEVNIKNIVGKMDIKTNGKLSDEQVRNIKHQVSCAFLDAFKQVPNNGKLNVNCMVKNIVIE
jgi:hypothetical protein